MANDCFYPRGFQNDFTADVKPRAGRENLRALKAFLWALMALDEFRYMLADTDVRPRYNV